MKAVVYEGPEWAAVPSGASTGMRAVLELCDGGAAFGGKGVTQGGVGDEGGFARELESNEAPLDLLVSAIETDGGRPGDDVAICLDSASSEFLHDGRYELACEGRSQSSAPMIELWSDIPERHRLRFLEDGLAESDGDGWKQLTDRHGDRFQGAVAMDLGQIETDAPGAAASGSRVQPAAAD